MVLDWPSIQPWQRASSTASVRVSEVGEVVFFLARVRSTPVDDVPFSVSQWDQAGALGRVSLGRGFMTVVVLFDSGKTPGMIQSTCSSKRSSGNMSQGQISCVHHGVEGTVSAATLISETDKRISHAGQL